MATMDAVLTAAQAHVVEFLPLYDLPKSLRQCNPAKITHPNTHSK